MNKVILLGAKGQLGQLVAESAPNYINLECFSHETLDITNHEAVKELILQVSPDIIINAAAYTAVDNAEKQHELANAINADAVENIAISTPPETRIIHISTDFVFSSNSERPYKAEDQIAPVSIYGQSKADGEEALLRHHPKNAIILRTSWLYSAKGKNFLTTMLRLMAERDELSIVNDQFGSPTSAHLLAQIIWGFALENHGIGIYHWSDRGVITWYDFALEIYSQARQLGILKKEVNIKAIATKDYPTPAVRPCYSALDSSATETLLGVKTSPWQEELHKVLKIIKDDDK